MSNIAMCKHDLCERKDNCLRYIDTPSENQPYVKFQNICPNKDYKWHWKTEVQITKKEENEKEEDKKE